MMLEFAILVLLDAALAYLLLNVVLVLKDILKLKSYVNLMQYIPVQLWIQRVFAILVSLDILNPDHPALLILLRAMLIAVAMLVLVNIT